MPGQQATFAPTRRVSDRAYLAWATVAVAYAIAFLQRVSPQSVGLSFMADFKTDAAGVAMLASSYFWGYTLMQIPAGLLVDRYGVKRVVLASMVASSIGSAAFALAPNLFDVFVARLVVACGDALVFTALLKLVAQSFADERFGVMSGISQVSGYIGGVVATTPLAAAVGGFGWRACFILIACVGAANLGFASLTLKPAPAAHSNKTLKSVLWASWRALAQLSNWGCAMSFASHFAVVTTLSGVWGIPMVAHFFNISPSAAGTPLLAFMVGNAAGSIFLGHAADRAGTALDNALIGICLLRMLLIAMLLPPLAHAAGLLYVGIVFAALGLVAGGTVPLVLKCTKRLYTAE
ncbi:MFS transporter, partial [Bradyrhizobium sp.]|uniref:MFS transporter n=1 Tax=Bradyrhizobium sp. TaxID=376 RepID=UPI003C6FA776